MREEAYMNAPDGRDVRPAAPTKREVRLGEEECPRCRKSFTASYWSGDTMVQARCLSCDLKWPLPDVV
jgi:NMD protein affecting ribosome stability and mRNA decay